MVGGEVGVRRLPETGGRQKLAEESSAASWADPDGRRSNGLEPVEPPGMGGLVEFTANRHARKRSETCRGDDRNVLEGFPPAPDPDRLTPGRARSAALLAITDDPALRDLLMELAIEEGWGVRSVETEAEAAVSIQTERPGLVLVDLDMDTRAGGKFLRTLRHSPHRDIPCFAVTNSNNTMLAVTLDAPVYLKPALDGLPEALLRLFGQPVSGAPGAATTSSAAAAAAGIHLLRPRRFTP
jgi:CheY-like chemotaxis protein